MRSWTPMTASVACLGMIACGPVDSSAAAQLGRLGTPVPRSAKATLGAATRRRTRSSPSSRGRVPLSTGRVVISRGRVATVTTVRPDR